jgi:HKD family nuclease
LGRRQNAEPPAGGNARGNEGALFYWWIYQTDWINMAILGLYANRNSHGDFVRNAIEALTQEAKNVYIAVAFFTERGVVEQILAKGSRIRLVVRLGFPTNPDALQDLLNRPGIDIRYFTAHSFHPKLYIFGNQTALVGSANLTSAAINSNQEVVVTIGSEDPRLNELAGLFSEYWVQAKVLTDDALNEYRKIYAKYARLQSEQGKLDDEVLTKLGTVAGSNITRGKAKESKENIFLEDYRKTYQECVSAFNVIRDAYASTATRKAGSVPLRIEIDSFISFVRDRHVVGEAWMAAPLRSPDSAAGPIKELIEEWHRTPWPHFEETIVMENYPRLIAGFSSSEAIKALSDDALFEGLSTLHSFYDRLRFYPGGLRTWKSVFLAANEPARTRDSLAYLLHGAGKIEERMSNMIYNPAYKLNQFGQSNVQELIGWCNKEELPIINGRTTKILRYFGFDVAQL